ncbi:hypothetical protein [Desulfonema magnum]|uniref:Alginate export domain-containing protein n=1 Tax=Desulfonema magnum TaxID=45655 RepID=A0A975BV04_9BACT|nr:hypothetical protein [Desulfonema magnum]QTA92330.1 Uncharacterized protein dnm_084080 [Desulfonema magnum]
MKKVIIGLMALSIALLPAGLMAEEVEFFGSLKTYPTFMSNVDFNDDDTSMDKILDENGFMADHAVRNEVRIGMKGGGDNWDFMVILESDFTLNKPNGDRGGNPSTDPMDAGMTGEDFGVEKVNFGYSFCPSFKINTGWNTKALDIHSGGILYGDDHPYIGLAGSAGPMKWEALYLIIFDEISTDKNSGILDGEELDWRVYTFRAGFDLGGFTIAPMYAFSDNDARNAEVHYAGLEAYGKLGFITPRLEFIYAMGDKDIGDQEFDINAWGAYASVDLNISKAFTPYFGGYYLTGDDDLSADDDELGAFNGISNISRYTPAFGIENAFIYRYVPGLSTHLYSNNFAMIGTKSGYGGISNSSMGDGPGMIMGGVGVKGSVGNFAYQLQGMHFMFAEEDAAAAALGLDEIDDEVGTEVDLRLTYNFNQHFSLGNTCAVFLPGDAIEERLGTDDTAILNTIELVWKF